MTVAVANTWAGSYTVPATYNPPPPPAALPLQIAVANAAGDWMFAVVTWRQPESGAGVTIAVADDVHNWWEPLGAPSGDSNASGVVRTAVWAAPAARAANYVQVAATGAYIAIAALVYDMSGLAPWLSVSAVRTTWANSGTGLSLSAPAPSAQALFFSANGADNLADSVTGPGTGWSSPAIVTDDNGVDHTADIQLISCWQVNTAGVSSSWSSSGSQDMAGIIAGVLVSAAAPSQPNPNWPAVITEVAPGSGAQTPPSQLSWTALSPRSLALSVQQGRQYTLSQLQAGQGQLTLDNPDGALIPPGTGSFAGVDSGTPVRQRVIIPSVTSPHNVAYSGFMKRWPFALPGEMLRGESACEITDVWGYAAGILNSMGREEMLLDNPYALWPLDDAAGSSAGSNIAPGNSNPLTLTQSKYGAGGAAITWGATGLTLTGDSSAKILSSGKTGGASGMFEQVLSGTSLNTNGYGYALVCADPNYPSVTNGVTIEAFFDINVATGGVQPFGAVTTGSLFTNSFESFTNGTPVVLSIAAGFSLPGGFSANVVYYVINVSGATFQLSASVGGSAITVTSNGSGYMNITTPWNMVIFSARGIKGPVAELDVRNYDGALLLTYKTASGTQATVVVDSSTDYRFHSAQLTYVALSFTQTSWRVITGYGPGAVFTGTFSSALPATFAELDFCGIQDRGIQGYAYSGYLALAAVYPVVLAPSRVFSHYLVSQYGISNEPAASRMEHLIEYVGLAGRRWVGQETTTYETDTVVSGQDIGGQSAAASASNIAASTVPGMLYVAPTGDLVYLAKWYAWNQPVKWTLGDKTSAGEIPFLPTQFSTDYDPARVVNDIQLTQLDSQTITVPSGVTSATTMAAVEAASEAQYGDQPYQVTGYLDFDATGPYTGGASLVDLANWIANVYAKPNNRVQAVTVNAAANAANSSSQQAWQFWAGASVGDMVQVNVRLPTAATSPLISLAARITQTNRSMKFSQDGTSAAIGCVLDFAPEYQALICDDATRGLLNGVNCLAWLWGSPPP